MNTRCEIVHNSVTVVHRQSTCEMQPDRETFQCESHSSNEDGDRLQRDDLVAGAQLIMTLNKRPYPVTLQKIISSLEPQTDSKLFLMLLILYIVPRMVVRV